MKLDIIGIDPGQKGAICYRSGESIEFFPLPFLEGEFDLAEAQDLLMTLKVRSSVENRSLKVYLEKGQSMPGNGGAAMFSYGRGIGMLEALLFSMGFSYEYIHPATWGKSLHRGTAKMKDKKKRNLLIAQRLFPSVNLLRTARCKKADEGFVDALLIAEYGVRVETGTASGGAEL